MKVSAEEVRNLLDLIHVKWRVGPTQLMNVVGYSRQTIHTWKKNGAPKNEYAKLKSFLQNGPDSKRVGHGANSPKSEFSIRLNLMVDVINPTDEDRAKVEKTISLLQSIRKSWA